MGTATHEEIVKTNTQSAVRNNVRAVLEDHIEDPRSRTKDSDLIKETNPIVTNADFDDYPVIILQNYSLGVGGTDDRTVDGWHEEVPGSFELHVEASEDSPRQREMFDTLCDDIYNTFRSTQRVTLGQNGFVNLELDGQPENENHLGVNSEFIRRKRFRFTFKTRLDLTPS